MKDKRLNKVKGDRGEDLAENYLLAHGFESICRNYRCPFGEIDIIARKGEVLHFVEVKSRSRDFIPGRYAVNSPKQRRIKKTAKNFLLEKSLFDNCLISFDVVEITDGDIEFLENCFY